MTLFPNAGLIRAAKPSDPDGVLRFVVSPSSRLFEGHFDGAPILPGVAHLALALSACAERALPGPLQGVRDVRFSRPIGPGDEIELELTAGRDPYSIRFDLRTSGQSATSGLLLFAPGDDARG